MARDAGVPESQVAAVVGRSRDQLRDRDILIEADRLSSDLDKGGDEVLERLPLVLTDEEFDARDRPLVGWTTLSHETAATIGHTHAATLDDFGESIENIMRARRDPHAV
jgi:hypothetical protein